MTNVIHNTALVVGYFVMAGAGLFAASWDFWHGLTAVAQRFVDTKHFVRIAIRYHRERQGVKGDA